MNDILIVDDELAICQVLSNLLEQQGYTTRTTASGEEAIEHIAKSRPDLVLLDYQLPGMTGIETLEKIKQRDDSIPVVIMTAYGTMENTMDAMRLGAHDFLSKPLELSQIRGMVKQVLNNTQTSESTRQKSKPSQSSSSIIGKSPALQEIFKLMGLLTTNDLTVLITGESGVGKELVARAIHQNSHRANDPFVAVNCAAIPENLLESELFGHEKGAFTGAERQQAGRFEIAGTGTIFLDEIGELPPQLQGKLLRVLQERQFERVGSSRLLPLNARIIAATNRDLLAETRKGSFREDLYYRLEMIKLHIPPLRERKEDIEVLAMHFVHRANEELKRKVISIAPEALKKLANYSWPGNVRELEHTIKRAVLLASGSDLSTNDIQLGQIDTESEQSSSDSWFEPISNLARNLVNELSDTQQAELTEKGVFHSLVSHFERAVIREALRKTGNNQVAAAKLLGLHRTTLRNKLDDQDS